eukprot:941150-Pyramimonas_sp.AAC.1
MKDKTPTNRLGSWLPACARARTSSTRGQRGTSSSQDMAGALPSGSTGGDAALVARQVRRSPRG